MNPLDALLTPANIATAIVVINFLAFAAFGIDKALAEQAARRVSEATLLQLAFIGGTPGAYAGRALFRHKTRKQPGSTRSPHCSCVRGRSPSCISVKADFRCDWCKDSCPPACAGITVHAARGCWCLCFRLKAKQSSAAI